MIKTSFVLLGLALLTSCNFVEEEPAARVVAERAMFTCTVASITDGDTLRCRELEADGKQIRVRLSGIAARERDGSCSANHPCPAASADAATAELTRLTGDGPLLCRQTGTTFSRRAAFCANAAGTDLSCAMVASGTAAKWERYWGDHRCP